MAGAARSLLFLAAAALATTSAGCRCSILTDDRPDECFRDLDCRATDEVFCERTSLCQRGLVGPSRCVPVASPCGTSLCDEENDACVSCRDTPEHPLCPPPPEDAGAPPACGVELGRSTPGAECISSRTCGRAGICEDERPIRLPTVHPDGSGGGLIDAVLFPGNACGSLCDPGDAAACGPCGACSASVLVGRLRWPVDEGGEARCRTRCEPSMESRGCDRPGYACDPETAACLEACTSDVECRLEIADVDGDGVAEIVDAGDASSAYCDAVTGRCRTLGRPDAAYGDACMGDGDCADDGTCLRFSAESMGRCTRTGCRHGLVDCPEGWACDLLALGHEGSVCLPRCRVGAELGTSAWLGPDGGSPDCRAGESCVWAGRASGTHAGSCVGGEYNAVAEPNHGAPCTSDAECWSPLGYGRCRYASDLALASGICTVLHCDPGGSGVLRGVALTVCEPSRGEVCAPTSRFGDDTACFVLCDEAEDCAPGYACAASAAGRTCRPRCLEASECRAGARCETPEGAPCDGGRCYCSDRVPRAP